MPACTANTAEGPGILCDYAMTACQLLGSAGVRVYVFVRGIDARGRATGPWRLDGQACVGPRDAPALVTPEMVLAAFRHLPFTPPSAVIEPVGGRTLVNLPTYYRARFARVRVNGRASVGPGARGRVLLLGHSVVIVPEPRSYVYVFGDGGRLGPTSDPGGAWPTGRVTHTYGATGQRPVRVTATYGGRYSIDGGPMIRLHGTVDITGPPTVLTVLSATNRLYAGQR